MPFACKHWFSQLISIVLQMQSNCHEPQKKWGLVRAEVLFSLMWFITALEKCSKYASSRLPPQSPALTVVDPCTMCGGAFLPSALDLSLHAVKRTEVRSPKSEFFPQSCNCVCEEEMKLPKLTIVFSAKEKYPFIKKHAVKVCIWRVLQGLETFVWKVNLLFDCRSETFLQYNLRLHNKSFSMATAAIPYLFLVQPECCFAFVAISCIPALQIFHLFYEYGLPIPAH